MFVTAFQSHCLFESILLYCKHNVNIKDYRWLYRICQSSPIKYPKGIPDQQPGGTTCLCKNWFQSPKWKGEGFCYWIEKSEVNCHEHQRNSVPKLLRVSRRSQSSTPYGSSTAIILLSLGLFGFFFKCFFQHLRTKCEPECQLETKTEGQKQNICESS